MTTPLTRKPDEGKSVYYIRYNLPIAAVLDAPFKEATEALWLGRPRSRHRCSRSSGDRQRDDPRSQ